MEGVSVLSNLAVGLDFRKRGVAKRLCRAVETGTNDDWIYLYVEASNRPAVKLYRSLGYRGCGVDKDARSLMPLEDGGLETRKVEVKVMRKRVRGNFLEKIFF